MPQPKISAVLIGRNEGPRLIACLESTVGHFDQIVYVDSGSTDGSQQAAQDRGVIVVALDMSTPFTAARARNAGLEHLRGLPETPDYVQFMDGDCILQQGWLEQAGAFLHENPKVAAVCGRNRERFPERTLYNRLADMEWDGTAGEARATGGNVMMRFDALTEAGGFNPALIAGEEPELCVRLRANGWTIWRLEAEMTLHDAAMTRFGQWWQRARRAGYTYAEGVAMHGAPPERHNVSRLRSTLMWGLALPLIILLGALLISPWVLLAVLIWPLQVLRLSAKGYPLLRSFFLVLAKFPETLGAGTYLLRRLRQAPSELIEYK